MQYIKYIYEQKYKKHLIFVNFNFCVSSYIVVKLINYLFFNLNVVVLAKRLYFVKKKYFNCNSVKFVIFFLMILQISFFLLYPIFNIPLELTLLFFIGPFVIKLINCNAICEEAYFKNDTIVLKYCRLFFFITIAIFFLDPSTLLSDKLFLFSIVCICLAIQLLYYGLKGFIILKSNSTKITMINEDFYKNRICWISVLFLVSLSFIMLLFISFFKDSYAFFYVLIIVFLTSFLLYIFISERKIYNNNLIENNLIINLEQNEIKVVHDKKEDEKFEKLKKSYSMNWEISQVDYLFEIIFKEKNKIDIVDNKYEKVKLSNDILLAMDIKIKKIVLGEQAYLDPNFKITDLSLRTKISRYHLSQYFSTIHNLTFKEYVNLLRINSVLDYAFEYDKKEELTVKELFLYSAFNSKTSFYQNFKNVTGTTPLDYIRGILEFSDIT
ncbi:helix-turn-helix domain-containing protein [Myroides odoratus]|uniref:AraC family transcriptional regulator n=2 Tax=Myroides odoratus TaxID=256 RepID=A0A9Q7E968_MYROD|nr:helix-turn-helix domain-containing protein [Myroides odoratus]EKB05733.1 hypothetical protein HMPREF9716_02684 [Myroides odoratus CIP 103059]EHQ44214.1 Helix-turn-helix, AraC domain-containing protein [Myroides odoratus DSM 2801]QQU01501.1 AraC family transcriptional regulator [Myroides odoratus]WQD56230.1 helix-turn-helix domain-containing protein [Myroides odoratus]STZ31530.1 DNA gyrase inhibitor [Myroides odoratus]